MKNTKTHLLSFFLVPFGAVLILAEGAEAATITSVASGQYTEGTTWLDGDAPAAGNDYVIGHSVQHNSNGDQALAGDRVTVNTGGTLRWHDSGQSPGGGEYLTINNLTLNGGTLIFSGSDGNSRNLRLANLLTVSAASTFQIGVNSGSFTNQSHFSGGITGSGNLSLVSHPASGGANRTRFYFTAADSTFTGNIDVSATLDRRGVLHAAAANALGTGSVTLHNAILQIDVANGIDNTSAVTLAHTNSLFTLTYGWNNSDGILTMLEGNGTIDLADSSSIIAAMIIDGHSVAAATYTAADLDALGYGGTFLGGTGTITIIPEPSVSMFLGALGMGLFLSRRR